MGTKQRKNYITGCTDHFRIFRLWTFTTESGKQSGKLF